MRIEESVALARRQYDLFNERKIDETIADCAPDILVEIVPFGLRIEGVEAYREHLERWITACPDAHARVKTARGGGSYALIEFSGTGTHRLPFVGGDGPVPASASGSRIEVDFCDVLKIDAGKVAGIRIYFDAWTLLRQTGLLAAVANAG